LIGSPKTQTEILAMTNDNVPAPHFYYGKPDIDDGAPWTDMAIADRVAAVEHGDTPEEAAGFPRRSGTVSDVKRKAEELGLTWRR
jgi:hypothetical protein